MIRRISRLERRIDGLPLDIQHDISDKLVRLENSIHAISSRSQEERNNIIPTLRANLEVVTTSLGELLGNRISQLEENISGISNDLRSFAINQNEQSTSINVSTDQLVSRDSEELIEIASGIASRASTVTGSSRSIATLSTRSTVRLAGGKRIVSPPASAPSILDQDGASPESVIMDSSLSVIGTPISSNKKEAIQSWISELGSQSTKSSRMPESFRGFEDQISPEHAPTESELLFTPPPSTMLHQQDDDIEVELAQLHWNLAQSLLVEGKNEAAIPHLKGVLLDIEGLRIRSDRWNRTDVQFLLAKTMVKASLQDDAAVLFKYVYESADSNPLNRASAAYFLATSILKKGVRKDIPDAKSFCMSSIKTRRKHLGPDDSATQSSVALIRDICSMNGDSDWVLWNSMLPQSLQISVAGYHQWTISSFPAKIAAVKITSQGQLVSNSYDGTQSIIRLFDAKNWNSVSETKLSLPVYDAIVADKKFRIIVQRQQNVHNSYQWYEAATSPSSSLLALKGGDFGLAQGAIDVALSYDGSRVHWCCQNYFNYACWGDWAIGPQRQIGARYSVGTGNSTITVVSNQGAVASACRRSVFVWSQHGGIPWEPSFESEVGFITFSTISPTLFVCCKDGSLHSLDISAGIGQAILKNQESINLIALSSDRTILATVKGKLIELWKFPSGESMEKPILGSVNFTAIAFSPDCKSIISGSADGTLQVWAFL